MRRIWHYLTQKTKPPHTGSFMWFAECENVTDTYRKIATKPPNQTHNATFHGFLRQENRCGCKQGCSSETQVKQNTVSFAGQLSQKLSGFLLRGWELTTSLHPVYPALFSVGWQKVPVWAGQQPPSKGWCLTHRIGNFSLKRYFSSTGLEVPEHVQPMPTGSFIQGNVPGGIKFLPLQTYFLNLLWRNSYPSVDWIPSPTRWHSKSHITSKKGSRESLPVTLLPLLCITLITGHHSVHKRSYGNHF